MLGEVRFNTEEVTRRQRHNGGEASATHGFVPWRDFAYVHKSRLTFAAIGLVR